MTSVPLHALSFLLKQPPRPMHRTSQHALPAVLEQIPNTPPPMDVISLWPTFLIPFLSLLTIFNSIKSNTSLWLICPFPFPLFFSLPGPWPGSSILTLALQESVTHPFPIIVSTARYFDRSFDPWGKQPFVELNDKDDNYYSTLNKETVSALFWPAAKVSDK